MMELRCDDGVPPAEEITLGCCQPKRRRVADIAGTALVAPGVGGHVSGLSALSNTSSTDDGWATTAVPSPEASLSVTSPSSSGGEFQVMSSETELCVAQAPRASAVQREKVRQKLLAALSY